MGWDGTGNVNRSNGTYTGTQIWQNERDDADPKIKAGRHDTHDQDMADAIKNTIAKDGQNAATANLPMGGFRHTAIANAAARDQYAAAGQVQDGVLNWVVSGGTADVITATYSPAIGTLVDGQLLFVRAGFANATTAPTFSPNGATARTIVKEGAGALVAGDIAAAGHELVLRYDLTNTRYELLNPVSAVDITGKMSDLVDDATPQLGGPLDTNAQAINESEGSAVASASSPDIWATDGNTLHLTGTTTITDFADAPRVGAWRKVVFDGILTFTHGSGITLPGAANITTAAGDIAFVYADAVNAFRVAYFKADGTAVVAAAPGWTDTGSIATTSGTTRDLTGLSSGLNEIHILLDGVRQNTADQVLMLQLGNSGGIEPSGYTSEVIQTIASPPSATSETTGFGMTDSTDFDAADVVTAKLVLIHFGSNKWSFSFQLSYASSSRYYIGVGWKTLSGELTQVRLTTKDGTAAFNLGVMDLTSRV